MHFENLLFVLLGLAFVVLRWLAQRATQSNKQPPRDRPEPPARAPAQSEEERVRRFMEALGNPVGAKPPPKVTPRPMQQARTASLAEKRKELERQIKAPKKSIWAEPLPPLTTTPPPAPAAKRVTLPQLIKTPPAEQKTFQPFTPDARFEVVGQSTPSATQVVTTPAMAYALVTQRGAVATPARPIDLRTLLSAPDGLRNAVVLREVFGPPRSVQPLDFVGDRVI
jgi:hypothetical protein